MVPTTYFSYAMRLLQRSVKWRQTAPIRRSFDNAPPLVEIPLPSAYAGVFHHIADLGVAPLRNVRRQTHSKSCRHDACAKCLQLYNTLKIQMRNAGKKPFSVPKLNETRIPKPRVFQIIRTA